jgi:hypothetical protein
MTVVVDTVLHVHEQQGSSDSRTPAGEMLSAYETRLGHPLAVGFVGHDHLVRTENRSIPTIDGVEHEKQTSPRRLHIVELVDHDIRYLAHPSETYPENTYERTREAIDEYNLDAVEKYNAGKQQYEGSLSVPELAGDDAHSPVGAGRSYMRVYAAGETEGEIVEAIMGGEFEVVNTNPPLSAAAHEVDKWGTLATELARGNESFPWESIM